jgi:hypothetical protein
MCFAKRVCEVLKARESEGEIKIELQRLIGLRQVGVVAFRRDDATGAGECFYAHTTGGLAFGFVAAGRRLVGPRGGCG